MTEHDRPREQVRITGLTKTFQRRRESVPVLRGIDLTIENGELLVLLGPSGCGKTTLLRCLVGLERPTAGSVRLGEETLVDARTGVFVPPNKRDVGMVFQNYALWPHMTVRKNVAYPLKARKLTDALRGGRVDEVLDVVQCGHLADRYPPELSGGQQQRVSLARALAPRPALMLLDEPLSNLDALLRVELRAQLRHLHRELGFTGVYVTHDQEEALTLATRVAVMREGVIEQIGTPQEVYAGPATEHVAEFLGVRNRLPVLTAADRGATVAGRELAGIGRRLDPDARHTLRLRPEHTVVRPQGGAGAGLPDMAWLTGAKIVEVLPSGDNTDYLIELDDLTLYARMPGGSGELRPGDQCEIGWRTGHALLYDADGVLIADGH